MQSLLSVCNPSENPLPQKIISAVLVGELAYFNHFHGKWVFMAKTAQLYVNDKSKQLSNVLIVLLSKESPPSKNEPTFACLTGPPGTSPYVMEVKEASSVVLGRYTNARCKKRKYRLDAEQACMQIGQSGKYLIHSLYCEFTFQHE